MNAPAIPVDEFDAEMKTTRRLLERMPSDRASWKPHPKSFSLGELTELVAAIPAWIGWTLRAPDFDLGRGEGGQGDGVFTTDALLASFDGNVRQAREALGEVTGAALDATWKLKMGDRVLMEMPRGAAARQHLMHLSHHRGQLTVYARQLDVKLPSIYGPTADESW